MKRREFITLLGGAVVTLPIAANAQRPAMPLIGFLGTGSPEMWSGRLRPFRQGLSETGYIEGRNVAIEYRWAEGHSDRLPDLAPIWSAATGTSTLLVPARDSLGDRINQPRRIGIGGVPR
jgi:hypothetical protein